VQRYGASRKQVVLLGMNPGPFGMMQTGVPFGEVAASTGARSPQPATAIWRLRWRLCNPHGCSVSAGTPSSATARFAVARIFTERGASIALPSNVQSNRRTPPANPEVGRPVHCLVRPRPAVFFQRDLARGRAKIGDCVEGLGLRSCDDCAMPQARFDTAQRVKPRLVANQVATWLRWLGRANRVRSPP
jgi:hypothetical protein